MRNTLATHKYSASVHLDRMVHQADRHTNVLTVYKCNDSIHLDGVPETGTINTF